VYMCFETFLIINMYCGEKHYHLKDWIHTFIWKFEEKNFIQHGRIKLIKYDSTEIFLLQINYILLVNCLKKYVGFHKISRSSTTVFNTDNNHKYFLIIRSSH